MLSILITQLLPLFLALLGAVLGVAIGIYVGPQEYPRAWCLAIAALFGLVVAGAAYLICDEIRIGRKVAALGMTTRREIDHASNIEYNARDRGARGTFDLNVFVAEIEEWRNRVDRLLTKELPGTGADLRFRTGNGPVGAGPDLYEYGRLTVLRSNLLAILDNLPSYVRRSK